MGKYLHQITELSETPANGDLILIQDVSDTTDSSSGTTKRITYSNLTSGLGGGGLSNVVEDTTPQLGGNLDVNGNSIVSTSGANITIAPNGTGNVILGTMTFDADQTIGSDQDNYVLTYDHSAGTIGLEAASGGSGSGIALTDLSVGAEAAASGDGAISYDNSTGVFTYTPPTAAGISAAAASHTHATSDITSGTFADARIAQSNVTQHQAALSITESQISDLGNYITLTDLSVGSEASASGNGALSYNSSTGVFTYTPPTLAGLNGSIDDLTDVTLTSTATNDILRWNGSAFVNTDAPTLDALQFDLTAAETAAVGQLAWNSEDLTLDLGLDTNVTLQIGQEQVARIKATTAIRNGMAVYVSGVTGGSDNLEGTPFSADSASGIDELRFLGIATETLSTNDIGFVTTFGKVRGVNGTTYASGGIRDNADTESWSVGDILYASPNIAGTLTSVVPTSPDRRMAIAIVLKVPSETNLTLFVRAEHGYHLNELHNVLISGTPADNEVLAYDSASGNWINQTATEAGIAATGHTHSTSDITSGTFADARIAESNVTQHQSALSITESQISDLGSYITASSTDNLTNKTFSDNITVAEIAPPSTPSTGFGTIYAKTDGKLYFKNDAGTETDLTAGFVTSVDMSVPTGFAISGNPVTTSGTLALAFDTGYSLPTTSSQTNWNTAYGWGDHSTAGYLTDITGENLSSLSDVTITSIASGELIKWNGSAWINNTLAEAGIAATGHTHSTSDITSGTFADARIAQSNVTQHQAALSITESQISDLGSYITASSTDTLTNKTFDANGTGNSLSNVETADIASGSKSGSDTTLVTGTAGTDGNVVTWNADGDAVDSGYAVSAFVGGVNYQGTWNASTNSPTIPAASSSNKGYYYKVSVAGSTSIDGETDWKVGDWIISNGTTWDKVDNTESVSSVFGRTGAVTASFSDISGTATHEQGGLEADVSAYSGLIKISGGATSAITDNSSDWDTAFGWGDHSLEGYLTNIDAESISSLADVTITSIASGEILKWSGTAWINNTLAEAGILSNVVEDTTPQLGGDLDVNGNSIVSVSNGDIVLAPDGTGVVQVNDQLVVGSSTTDLGTATIYGHDKTNPVLVLKSLGDVDQDDTLDTQGDSDSPGNQMSDIVQIRDVQDTNLIRVDKNGHLAIHSQPDYLWAEAATDPVNDPWAENEGSPGTTNRNGNDYGISYLYHAGSYTVLEDSPLDSFNSGRNFQFRISQSAAYSDANVKMQREVAYSNNANSILEINGTSGTLIQTTDAALIDASLANYGDETNDISTDTRTLTIRTGNILDGSGARDTGAIIIQSGQIESSVATGDTGAVTISSGSSSTGGSSTGAVSIGSGATDGETGSLTIGSGNSSGDNNTGAVTIFTGNVSGSISGDSGSLTLQTGDSTAGSSGDIILATGQDGGGGTYGDVRPNGDGTQNLGTASNRWKAFYQTTNYFVETGAGTNYVAFTAPSSIASNITWTLPNADGSSGQVLSTNGSGTLSWVTASGGGGIALTDLSVGAEASASGDGAISYDNTTGVFTYTPPTAAGINAAAASHNHATSDITSGTFADARIAQSNVTQHQAALSITESQISDLGSYITASSTNTLTNKTFDANGTGNSLSNVETADIASGSKTGSDTTLVTGTAGTNGNLVSWNADGDAVDSSIVASNVALTDGDTYTGTHDFGGATLEIPNGAAPSLSVAGQIALDTSTTDHTALLKYHDGTNEFVIPAILSSGLSTTDNDVIAYNAANNRFEMEAQSGSGGGITNVVEDSTPQLGGQLDVNGQAIGDGTRELLTFTEDASAVNHVNIENEATGSGPIISAAGDDTNIDLNLAAKGTGDISLGTMVFDADQTIGAGQDNYVLTYDNATGKISLEAAAGGGGISNVVEDTTPQLGGQLDVNGNAIGDGTLELLTFTEDASAVNHINIENEATGSGPIISAAGDDTNIDLNLSAKGTGNISLGNMTFDADQTIGSGQDNYVLTYDHSAGTISLEAASGGGISNVVEDTTPQLGGDLDVNGNSIVSVSNGNITLAPDGTGVVQVNDQLVVGSSATALATTTIYGHSSTDEALVVRAASSQAVDIFRIEDNSGTELLSVDSAGRIGTGPSLPNAKLSIDGSISLPIEVNSSSVTLDDTNHTVVIDASGGNRTVSLPAASGSEGKIFIIKKIDSSANNVIIDADGVDTIDGSSTFTFNSQYRSVTIQSGGGTNWWIISSYIVNY